MMKNGHCGLCGHYDGEKYDEFRRSDNKQAADLEEYHRSYFHEDDECDIDENVVGDKRYYDSIRESLGQRIVQTVFIEKSINIKKVIHEERFIGGSENTIQIRNEVLD